MSRVLSPVTTSDTFQVWLQRSNDVISELGTTVMTASTLGDTTTGDATLIGSFTANDITSQNIIRTNAIGTKAGNTSPITISGQSEFTSTTQNSIVIRNSVGPRIKVQNNDISWLMGLRGSAGTGTNAEFIVGVEGSNFAFRIGANGTLYANTILLDTVSTATNGVVVGSRSVIGGAGLSGGGNLTANRTLSLAGNALSLFNLSTNGFVVRNGSGSIVARDILAGYGIVVTNGDGVSGNTSIEVDLSRIVSSEYTQTITGKKTFSQSINASIDGNAATVTNGVYSIGDQTISGVKTFSSPPIIGTWSGDVGETQELLIRSKGYAGISIAGDISDSAGEPGGAYISYSLDGAPSKQAILGMTQSANTGPDGTALSGEIYANNLILGSYINQPIKFVVNKALVGTFTTTGTFQTVGNVVVTSDSRFKTNIETIDGALDLVSQMRGARFTKNGHPDIGVIAQEMEQVLPEVVHEDQSGYKAVAYGNLVGVLIEAIKTLKQRVEYLEEKVK